MKYLSFIRPDGQATIGKIEGKLTGDVENNEVTELLAENSHVTDLKSALKNNSLHQLIEGSSYSLNEIRFLPLIPNPGKILCVGLNYKTHIEETGLGKDASYPVIFTRFADTLVAHGEPIIQPLASTKLDYEGELAIVISKGGRAIPEQDAFDHIAGYSCFNDASVRDWQRHASQYTPGKNFPATGGFGPWLVTPDEIDNLQDQHVTTKLNSEKVQDQPISDLIFSIPFLINYISSFTPLLPGDVIVTGTPGGVGGARKPPLWMKPGDTVKVSVGEIGTLINSIQTEQQ
ncbi:MAG: 5-carboxymethyl-2-hydroxymuconate isomerase [SAR86 cluster bacterium]|uniref:5-carboxymethyl-2-hydroxymuconate isomerase n=1 Tax=SAR86 cluster bacterium TaxID=2030880 RepID=A0A2A5CDJ8_9GAMM|nr:MAG: 5-carboxymethyl-2-hydroxymuconate isomerase [SAR86 cluster bacterium]